LLSSVRLSVRYMANNSRTQRPSVPKFGRKVPHLRSYSHTSFRAKRSKFRVTGRLMQTHKMCHTFRTVRPKLQSWCADGGRRPASAASAMTKCCTYVIRCGRGHIPCRPNPAATFLVDQVGGRYMGEYYCLMP